MKEHFLRNIQIIKSTIAISNKFRDQHSISHRYFLFILFR